MDLMTCHLCGRDDGIHDDPAKCCRQEAQVVIQWLLEALAERDEATSHDATEAARTWRNRWSQTRRPNVEGDT